MFRLAVAALVISSSGCALRGAHLVTHGSQTFTRIGDERCGPIGIRRATLGARWGEYVRVSVRSPTPLMGEARLHVDGRAYPLQRFTTAPTLDAEASIAVAATEVAVTVPAVVPFQAPGAPTIVLDAAWTNERLDVASALSAGSLIDVTLTDLQTAHGSCSDVVFTVEQGVFQPTVDERAWVAELTRRGGPALQAFFAAQAQHREEVRRAHLVELEQRATQRRLEAAARAEANRLEAIAFEAARRELAQAVRVAEGRRLQVERAAAAAVSVELAGAAPMSGAGAAVPPAGSALAGSICAEQACPAGPTMSGATLASVEQSAGASCPSGAVMHAGGLQPPAGSSGSMSSAPTTCAAAPPGLSARGDEVARSSGSTGSVPVTCTTGACAAGGIAPPGAAGSMKPNAVVVSAPTTDVSIEETLEAEWSTPGVDSAEWAMPPALTGVAVSSTTVTATEAVTPARIEPVAVSTVDVSVVAPAPTVVVEAQAVPLFLQLFGAVLRAVVNSPPAPPAHQVHGAVPVPAHRAVPAQAPSQQQR